MAPTVISEIDRQKLTGCSGVRVKRRRRRRGRRRTTLNTEEIHHVRSQIT